MRDVIFARSRRHSEIKLPIITSHVDLVQFLLVTSEWVALFPVVLFQNDAAIARI
jgi:hypothetical protein